MLTLRPSSSRGQADHGWLQSFHSFSFADYHDPAHMGVGNLRVINEDRVAAGSGFGTHAHRDMEIVTYVLEGALAHRDDIAAARSVRPLQAEASQPAVPPATGIILPGDVQRMSAGTGVRHSEFNAAETTTHFLQIWILPRRTGLDPGYEQKHFSADSKRGRLVEVAAPDGTGGAVTVQADARIRAGLFTGEECAELALDPRRLAYVHLVRGRLHVNGRPLLGGDAARIEGETALVLDRADDAEVLVFDLAT